MIGDFPPVAPVDAGTVDQRFGNVEVRPLGGGVGCLTMIVLSVFLSLLLTLLVNLVL